MIAVSLLPLFPALSNTVYADIPFSIFEQSYVVLCFISLYLVIGGKGGQFYHELNLARGPISPGIPHQSPNCPLSNENIHHRLLDLDPSLTSWGLWASPFPSPGLIFGSVNCGS